MAQQSLAAVSGANGRVTIGDETYEVLPLTVRVLGEFENHLKERQRQDYIAFYKSFAKAGSPVGFEERSKAMARIVSQPFSFQDVATAMETTTGGSWLLARVLCKNGQPVGEAVVNDFTAGQILVASAEVAVQGGFIEPPNPEEIGKVNPTNQRQEE